METCWGALLSQKAYDQGGVIELDQLVLAIDSHNRPVLAHSHLAALKIEGELKKKNWRKEKMISHLLCG